MGSYSCTRRFFCEERHGICLELGEEEHIRRVERGGYEVRNELDRGLEVWASVDHALISGWGKGGITIKWVELIQLKGFG